jgi:mannan endo-1,4-beta-mannosidase
LSYVLFWRNAWDKPQEEAYLPGVGDGAIVEDFKAFKKEKKVLSPNLSDDKTVEKFLERFPGEKYVDMLGVDVYEFDNSDANYQQNLAATLDVLMEAAKKVGKIPALTETGCRGIASKKDWFTQTLWPVLQKYQLSYVLFWRNAWDKPQEEAYLPGVGDGAIVEDFKAFKKEKKVLFAKDIVKVK